jgi:hypothetical protein
MFPIRILEGEGYRRVAAAGGEIVAEVPAGYEVASAMVRGANNYPALIALLKRFVGGEAPVAEAKNLLAYLGEPA